MTAEEWGQVAAIVLVPLAVAAVVYLTGTLLAWRRPLPHQVSLRRWSVASALGAGGLCFVILLYNHLTGA